MSGNIIVVEPESRFKKIDKSLIENPNIDCLTLGIYAKIVSFGEKWKLNIKGLSVFLGLSDTKVRKSISLLEKEGYIVREPIKDEKGYFQGYNYKVFPTPIDEEKRSNAGKKGGVIENRGSAKSGYPENVPPINNKTKNNNKTILNNKKEKEKDKEKEKFCEYKMADPCKYCTRAKTAPVQKTSKDPCKNCIFTRAKIAHNNILNNFNKKEKEKEEMANANNFKVKQYVDLYNSYINNENALFKLYQELHIDVSCIKQLLFIFTYRLNKEKASNALNYIEHFKNWLNTDAGKKAIKDIKLSM